MSLVLTIVKQPAGQQVTETRKLFGEAGGTLGRAGSCSWHLPDPSRFVSSQHASIRYANGEYYLVDTSTNGVYVNDNPQPMGTGNEVRLSQGDRLYIGEYEVHVAFEQSVAQDLSNDDFDRWLDPQSPTDDVPGEATGSIADLLATPGTELDPLAALDRLSGDGLSPRPPASDADWLMGQSDNAPAASHAFVPPAAIPEDAAPPPASTGTGADGGVIPDDWDIDDLLAGDPTPAPTPAASPPPAAPKPQPAQQHPLMATADPEYAPPPPATGDVASDHGESTDPSGLRGETDEHLDNIVPPDEGEAKVQQEASELDAFLGLTDSDGSADPVAATPAAPTPGDLPAHPEPLPAEPEPVVAPPEVEPEPVSVEPAKPAEHAVPPNAAQPAPAAARSADAPQPVAATTPSAGDLSDQLIRSLGLEPGMVNAKQREAFDQIVIDMLRESLKGMMQVLGARQAIKNEFRMSVTLIQAAENNPLKFSPNVDEALRNMFASHTNAYLPGVLAIRDGFNDIADHQVAVVAGMRAAFRSLLKRFDPAELQLRFDKMQSRSALLSGKKARYWESYTEFYADLANNMDEAFQDLFGEDFAEAYEQQMSRLEAARKT